MPCGKPRTRRPAPSRSSVPARCGALRVPVRSALRRAAPAPRIRRVSAESARRSARPRALRASGPSPTRSATPVELEVGALAGEVEALEVEPSVGVADARPARSRARRTPAAAAPGRRGVASALTAAGVSSGPPIRTVARRDHGQRRGKTRLHDAQERVEARRARGERERRLVGGRRADGARERQVHARGAAAPVDADAAFARADELELEAADPLVAHEEARRAERGAQRAAG